MEFTGSGFRYFRLWIVSIGLTVLSVGLYSPWATVRKLKYWSEHTRVGDEILEFRGRAEPILFGRLILFFILAMWFLVSLFPWVAVLVVLGVAAVPSLLVYRYRFYWSGHSLGGVPFQFCGRMGSSYRVYLAAVLISLLTFFVGTPWAWFLHRRFQLENTRLGVESLEFRGKAWPFALCYLPAFIVASFAVLAWVALVYVVGPDRMDEFRVWPWLLLYSLPFYLVFLFCMASIQARIGNYLWNHSTLGDRSFKAEFETIDLFGIYIQNSFFMLISGGLAWPWARVQLWKYRAERVSVIRSVSQRNTSFA